MTVASQFVDLSTQSAVLFNQLITTARQLRLTGLQLLHTKLYYTNNSKYDHLSIECGHFAGVYLDFPTMALGYSVLGCAHTDTTHSTTRVFVVLRVKQKTKS